MTFEVRRAAERFTTSGDGIESRHCFSFGAHYDARNTHHGLLIASNEHVVAPGAGFPEHSHRDMEIVTWVLDGELAHRDTLGNAGVLRPGVAQRTSAGTGIRHSEGNARTDAILRFVQMWVRPGTPPGAPSYEQVDVDPERDGLATVVSWLAATLRAGWLRPRETVALPDGTHVHLYVARGTATLEGAGELCEGDAVRLTTAGPPSLTAGTAGAEVLVWQTT